MSVLCLIANPADPVLDSRLVAAIQHESGGEINWLYHGVACELVSPTAPDPLAIARAAIGKARVDAALVPLAHRRKRLLVADMDSTMIDQECIDELADEVGIKAEVSAITAMAMNNEIAFEPALRQRVALLAGLDESVIERLVRDRITLAGGARELVATMNRDGAWTALVSGGFDAFTARIAARLGFREHRANRLLTAQGRLTGKVAEPILGREAKAAAIREIAARLGIGLDAALAVGDGANDLDMLALAGAGVALHAKPAVAAQARIRIDHGDLTALLYLQGYRRAEFAA